MSRASDEPDEAVEIVGDYTPEIEELLRDAKRNRSYFDDTEESREAAIELLATDPILSRLTDADPEDFEGYRDEDG
jgi:hypothetical protein